MKNISSLIRLFFIIVLSGVSIVVFIFGIFHLFDWAIKDIVEKVLFNL